MLVCLFVCLDWPLTVNFKWAHSNISRLNVHVRRCVLQLSRENSWEGLLPECRVSTKESKSKDNLSWIHWQHTWVWWSRDKAGCEWQTAECTVAKFASGISLAWPIIHSRIPPLAHALTVELRPCQCSQSSPSGWMNNCMSVCVINYTWAFQTEFATHSGSPQDDTASFYSSIWRDWAETWVNFIIHSTVWQLLKSNMERIVTLM